MIKVRRSLERGQANHGWLQSFHTFSFADYHDPKHMGFSALRVINEDWVAAQAGFPTHGHQNMEIITYVISGVLEHKDSMGNSTKIYPGEVQRMSAGTGVRHSEYNPTTDQKTHLLQIWILPDQLGHPPSYEQKDFKTQLATQDLVKVVSAKSGGEAVSLHQDVEMYVGKPAQAGEKIINTDESRFYWVQLVKGNLQVNEEFLTAGDAVAVHLVKRIHFKWQPNTEFILFDLP